MDLPALPSPPATTSERRVAPVHCALRALAVTAMAVSIGCGGCGSDPERLDRAALLDPETCRNCHPRHYEEWSGSMHAYAAEDPVFLAMNRRGQEETGGALGSFCVQCHAPMAVAEGATVDGLNLEQVPKQLRGVTCYFCHNVAEVQGDHNNPLLLANDLTMRGAFAPTVENGVHGQLHSPLVDRELVESSALCGACHDIVTQRGVHLERTFLEWKQSFFNRAPREGGLSCSKCHMNSDEGVVVADFPGAGPRTHHSHAFPGVDVALTDFPEKDEQLAAIDADLKASILPKVCYNPSQGGRIEVTLDNIGAGHALPSGATQDRRMWLELRAESGGSPVLVSGAVADGVAVATAAAGDPLLWQMRDFARKENGEEAHMFWDVATIESSLLAPLVTIDPSDPNFIHSTTRFYPLAPAPERIEIVVHLRPIGLEIIDDLIASGHLDAKHRDALPTHTIESTRLVWTPEAAGPDLCVEPAP